MTELPDLKQLSDEAKDALIVELWEALQALRQKTAKKPKKTSKNSSQPPSKGFKANQAEKVKGNTKDVPGKRAGSIGRAGGGRPLSDNPDQIIKAELKACGHCGEGLTSSLQRLIERYDKIDIPPIRPVVTRVERYGCDCPNCGQSQIAPVPIGMEPGSPFSDNIAALVTSLRYGQAISYERLNRLMGEVFSLSISEGAIANLLQRVKGKLSSTVAGIVQRLQSSRLVGSDETSARVQGRNQWEWVFQNEQVCLHVIRPSRGGEVITEVMAGHRPKIWISDLFSAQKTHPAESWQVCLAHQLRDCQYGIDAGDEVFSPVMKQLLLRAITIRKRWSDLAISTRDQYRRNLHHRLRVALALSPTQDDGSRLQNRYRDLQDNLFLFLDDITIPTTNNASEQALRWSVIFRKVTNGFRSDWGKDLFAQVRSVVNTGKRQGLSAFQAIAAALDPGKSLFPLS